MPHRAVSPAASENEFDLAKAWFPDEDESRLGNVSTFTQNGSRSLGVDAEMGGDDEDEDGDEEFIAAQLAASNRKSSNLKGRSVKKGGGFQAMGLNANLLKAITRKGFSVPTPIQRKTIPLVLDGQDVVGMARTGSGKTAAFVVPMIEKLKAHSAKVGSRALIMSPSRELALQTLKVVKEFSRGTDLRSVLLVGGDSLEEQFQFMSSNPDIVIATPGRFLHLKVEMSLDLSSYRYVVFDEADRLFEMGFATQLAEILHALPSSRQTLLFSATLPKSLVEFAKAGLQDPSLIRLDAETKVSPDLQSAFFTIKSAEKEGALLHILHDVIKMPTGMTEAAQRQVQEEKKQSKKRKRDDDRPRGSDSPTPHSTIVFAATKHHVEYLATLLRESGFAVSHVYGSLDQTARKFQVQDFRSGLSNVLVVTDVAARGIDIPILANVINYDFPPQPKIYVHRVGRTARAGRTGWSYSLVSETDAPYLLDLQLFLGRKLVFGVDVSQDWTFASDVVVGGMIRDKVERNLEFVTKLLDESSDLALLRSVATKGEKLYLRTRNSASAESAKRSREVVASEGWRTLNPLFKDEVDSVEVERAKMLARVSGFRPQETVFEIGKRGAAGTTGELAELLRKRREKILAPKRTTNDEREEMVSDQARMGGKETQTSSYEDSSSAVEAQSEDELEVTLSHPSANDQADPSSSWKDTENFMSYTPTASNVAEERGYGVHSGSYNTASQSSNFIQAAQGVTMDFNNDDGAKSFAEPSKARGMRWDKKSKKYVARANDIDGSRGAKVIKGESGQKIAASFRSGRFDAWRKSNKIDRLPRVGEAESSTQQHQHFGRRYKHNKELAPKQADKYRDDYHSRKKRVEEAKEKRIGKFKEGSGKNELKGVDDIRKDRKLKEKRREKNARPSKKRKF